MKKKELMKKWILFPVILLFLCWLFRWLDYLLASNPEATPPSLITVGSIAFTLIATIYLNVFVKPNEQSQTGLSSAMARKRRMKSNLSKQHKE